MFVGMYSLWVGVILIPISLHFLPFIIESIYITHNDMWYVYPHTDLILYIYIYIYITFEPKYLHIQL